MTTKTEPARRADYAWFIRIPTRWMDNDVYAHVNNVQYYSYFDTAVNAHLIEKDLLDYERGQTVCLVVETSCLYRKPISFPDIVSVGLRVDRLGGSSVVYGLGAFCGEDDDAAAECRYVHVHVDKTSRRPTPFNAEWRTTLAPLIVEA